VASDSPFGARVHVADAAFLGGPPPRRPRGRSRDAASGGNYFMRHWRGQMSLGRSYWVNSFLLGNLAPVAVMIALGSIEGDNETSLRVNAALSLASVALLGLLNLWSAVGVLRSAANHPERGGRLTWAVAAFLMVAVSLISVFFQLTRKNSLDGYADLAQIAMGHDTIPVLSVKVAPDGLSVLLSGPIGSGSTDQFKRVLDGAWQATTVRLDSPGGRVFEGLGIAREVQRRHLDTFAEGECSSACTLVLLAGHERLITREPHVGFHRASRPGPQGSDRAATRSLVRLYRKAGVNDRFIAAIAATPSTSIWYPTLDQLLDNSIATGIAPDAPPVALAPAPAPAPAGVTRKH
jgi:hypothetical protein